MIDYSYLKRTDGKNNGDIKRKHFYQHYSKNHKAKKVTKTVYNDFLTDVVETLMTEMITNNLEVHLPTVGRFRIRANKTNFISERTGRLIAKVDWKATWVYWESKYSNLSRPEIVAIKDKKVIYHENNHSQGESYNFHWDKVTTNIANKFLYKFEPTRTFARLLAQTVKDPNRKVFYYG